MTSLSFNLDSPAAFTDADFLGLSAFYSAASASAWQVTARGYPGAFVDIQPTDTQDDDYHVPNGSTPITQGDMWVTSGSTATSGGLPEGAVRLVGSIARGGQSGSALTTTFAGDPFILGVGAGRLTSPPSYYGEFVGSYFTSRAAQLGHGDLRRW